VANGTGTGESEEGGYGMGVNSSITGSDGSLSKLKEGSENHNVLSGPHQNDDWVQDWVNRGSQGSQSNGSIPNNSTGETSGENGVKRALKLVAVVPAVEGGSTEESSNKNEQSQQQTNNELLRQPYDMTHSRTSSLARLQRLAIRRRQSSVGTDASNRLFRAHEAGLVVTPGGSARRSLMRMGLPMEKGMYGSAAPPSLATPGPVFSRDLSDDTNGVIAPPPPLKNIANQKNNNNKVHVDKEDMLDAPSLPLKDNTKENGNNNNITILTGNATMSQQVEPITFEKALAKMDERTIRRIEKEERAKEKLENQQQLAVSGAAGAGHGGGCMSPLSMSILRKMFASKQFSFHRSSSSYSRFDSFLTSAESEILSAGGESSSAIGLDLSDKGEIFRPSTRVRRPSTSQERLRNLLVNAGFRHANEEDDDDAELMVDAAEEDDADILSTSMNSVAQLVKGGPSYRNVNMFRGESEEEEEESPGKKKNVPSKDGTTQKDGRGLGKSPVDTLLVGPVKKIQVQEVNSSLISSLGSKSSSPPPDEIIQIDTHPSDEGGDSKVSPANSDLGELPILTSSGIERLSKSEHVPKHQRSSTVSIMKSTSSSTNNASSPTSRAKYKRSVSWGHMVFSKDEVKSALSSGTSNNNKLARQDSVSSQMSVISFPHLSRAAPLRSDSIGTLGSNASTAVLSYPPPLRLGVPLRSESIGSVASALSPIPTLSRAHPVYSPRPSIARGTSVSSMSISAFPPFLSQLSRDGHSIRSLSQMTSTTGRMDDDFTDDDDGSLNSEDYVDAKPGHRGAAWQSPLVSEKRPPLHGRAPSAASAGGGGGEKGGKPQLFLRQASCNNYEGMGIEIEELPLSPEGESIDNARKYKSLISTESIDRSGHSFRRSRSHQRSPSPRSLHSRNNSFMPQITSLDDSFIIKNIDFERHTSEILRSLSNEDLYTSHHLQTINGGSSKGSNLQEASSVAPVVGNALTSDTGSWEMESSSSFNAIGKPANAWAVFEDEYAEGYGAHGTLPFRILGTSAADTDCHPHVLSPPLMESLQNFMPPTISETNFWLKYSLVRDGASLPSLLRHIRGTRHTLIAIETVEGEVFGSFTSSPWRKNWNYYGVGESFLWRMRRTRAEKDIQHSVLDQAKLESELDVFYYTGRNDFVQYCTQDMLALGGGSLNDAATDDRDDVTDSGEQRELPPRSNPKISKADKGGFGLAIDSELLRGTSSQCATFGSPPLSKMHADGSPFEILNMEVWTMTPCGNLGDAENLEMKTLFLEAYSREF